MTQPKKNYRHKHIRTYVAKLVKHLAKDGKTPEIAHGSQLSTTVTGSIPIVREKHRIGESAKRLKRASKRRGTQPKTQGASHKGPFFH